MTSFKAFAISEFAAYLDERLSHISKEIESQTEDYLLNVNRLEYRAHLVEKFAIEPPVLLTNDMTMDRAERMVPAEKFPFNYNVFPGKSYPRTAYIIHIPVAGESHLLKYSPSHRLVWTHQVSLSNDVLTFEIVPFAEEPAEIRRFIDDIVGKLERQLRNLCADVNTFNLNLEAEVQKRLEGRVTKLLRQREVLDGIGIPLRKRDDIPATFAVPAPARPKKIRPRPAAGVPASPPDPTLADDDYRAILRVIHDFGVNLERYPSTYEGKDEESLRDYLLLLLQPQFEGSATGETFNKSGKTDILLRYENRNVFVAECKFWTGAKSLLKAVGQLLSYLTWRDSKAALVLFVGTKAFSEVLGKIEAALPTHEMFREFVGRDDEAWLEFRFALPDDPDRLMTLTVLAFHLPPKQAPAP